MSEYYNYNEFNIEDSPLPKAPLMLGPDRMIETERFQFHMRQHGPYLGCVISARASDKPFAIVASIDAYDKKMPNDWDGSFLRLYAVKINSDGPWIQDANTEIENIRAREEAMVEQEEFERARASDMAVEELKTNWGKRQ